MNLGTAQVIRGDARRLPLADNSVDLVVTSPPYLALRSYQDGGVHYAGQIGSEPTPAEFVAALLEVTAECVRVLKPSGSLWVNLGDKYSGAQAQNIGGANRAGDSSRTWAQTNPKRTGIPNKSLMGIPWRYALACIDQLGLILRAEVIWAKGNGLPESVQDRVRRSHETWFHFVLNPRYYSAVDTIREPFAVGASSSTRRTPVVGRPAGSAPLRRAALGPELSATVHTDDGPADARGWCHLGQPQVTVDLPVADVAHRLQVVEHVGFEVRVEAPERDLVVDLKMVDPRPAVALAADGASMPVSVQNCLSLLDPIGATIAVSTAAPRGVVLAYQGAAPSAVALGGAEATNLEVALGSGHGFAARITLTSDEGGPALYVWDSLAAHTASLPLNSEPLGKLPGSVWHINTEPLTVPDHLGVDHFAAFPTEWPRRIIRGWSPAGVCVECGEGRRPVSVKSAATDAPADAWGGASPDSKFRRIGATFGVGVETTITGYVCACPEPTAPTTPSVILDPFGGTGTVAMVAKALGRHGITVDMSADYSRLAAWRTGDRNQLAKVLGIPKAEPVSVDQYDLFGEVTA